MAYPGLLLAAVVSAAAAPSADVIFVDGAIAHGREVRLSDVADVSVLPISIRAQAAALVLAHFAPRQRQLDISTVRLAERARAQLPILAGYLRADRRVVTIRLDGVEPHVAPRLATPVSCIRLLKPIGLGDAPIAGELEPADCGQTTARRAFGYDVSNHVARAVRPLTAGEIVGALPESSVASVRAGDAYTLTARAGPVVVHRRVVAVQSARPGEEMFVAGDDGEVFAAPQPNPAEAQ